MANIGNTVTPLLYPKRHRSTNTCKRVLQCTSTAIRASPDPVHPILPSCDRSRHRAGSGSLSRNSNCTAAPSTLQPRATPERHGRILGAAEPSPPPDRAEPRPVAGRSKVLSAELVREECSTRPFDCSTRGSAAPSSCHSPRSCHSSCASRGLDGTFMRTWLQQQGISPLLDGPRSDAAASRPATRVVQGASS